ncbi:hypothetical protein FOL47_009888 [Perkinsus chesapeaki]|uniref:RING-type domain-containing protein n=1 Tax=Perkinsus chesapeaki TaxID=330153 RepID=A0A7J6MRW5_PERCH|nr:hypothetical protein FOL47_009888 [Perkinsus chesapeaki]
MESSEPTTAGSCFECPICLRLLVEPVTTACGHTFCKYCIRKSMDHRQLCPTCRAPCPFIGNTNVMIANLIQHKFPQEYATRLDEVKELEAQEESSSSTDASAAAADHGVFFPFIKLPEGAVLYPYGNRLAVNVEAIEAEAARGIWRGGAARSVVIEMEDASEQHSLAVLGEIAQIRGNRIVVIGRGRVNAVGNNEIYTNTSGIRVKKYAASPIKDTIEEQQQQNNTMELANTCLSLLYDNRLPRVGEMGLRKFHQLHGDRRRPSRAQLGAMTPLELEKLSFWLCSCLRAPNTLRLEWLRSRDTFTRVQSIKDYIDNAGASQIINLEEDAAGGSPGLFRGISWSFALLLAIFLALFLKYSGWLDNRYGGISDATANHQKHYVHKNLILNWDKLSNASTDDDDALPRMCGIGVAGRQSEVCGWGMLTTGRTAKSFALRVMHDKTVDGPINDDVFNDPLKAIAQWFSKRLAAALSARMRMFDLSFRRCYRLLNYEGDGVTGVAVDVYDNIAVVYVSAQWVCMDGLRELLDDIIITQVVQVNRVLWKFRKDLLLADGRMEEPVEKGEEKAKVDDLIISENSLKFAVDVCGGKKTGWFLDQTDNRRKVMEYVKRVQPMKIADLCCYTGGFAIHAAAAAVAGREGRVIGVDMQEKSIEVAKANSKLNGKDIESRIDWMVSDVGDFLRNTKDEFDLIILDPPNIVKECGDNKLPKRRLRRFTELSLIKVNKMNGGCLWVFSCSHELSREGVLEDVVGAAAVRSGRRVKVVEELGASVDHMYSPYHANSKHLRGLVVMVEPSYN